MAPALGDVRVRQAINYAFDRKAMLKAVSLGDGDVTASIFSTKSTGYVEALDELLLLRPQEGQEAVGRCWLRGW